MESSKREFSVIDAVGEKHRRIPCLSDICAETRNAIMGLTPKIGLEVLHIQNCRSCRIWYGIWKNEWRTTWSGVRAWDSEIY